MTRTPRLSRTATAVMAALVVSLGLMGCDSRVFLLLEASNVPLLSASMQVIATRGEATATNRPVVVLTDLGERTTFTFGLQFPSDTRGDVAVGVVTRSADGCLTSVGDVNTALVEGVMQTSAALMLNPVTIKECRQTVPLMLSVTPATAAVGEQVDILGFGFTPKLTVAIAGRTVTEMKWQSPARLRVTIPPDPIVKMGPVDITITNTDLSQTRRSDLLSLK